MTLGLISAPLHRGAALRELSPLSKIAIEEQRILLYSQSIYNSHNGICSLSLPTLASCVLAIVGEDSLPGPTGSSWRG